MSLWLLGGGRNENVLSCALPRGSAQKGCHLSQGLVDGKEALTQPVRISKSSLLLGVWRLQASAWDGACGTMSRELARPCCEAVGVL